VSGLEDGGEFDVVVIGAGCGGIIAAAVLAEAGKTVLLLERGKALAYPQVGRDHLRNHRLATYGHNTGPELDGNPRVIESPDGTVRIARPHEGAYHNNAMTVGGGGRVFGGQAWRFHPRDFRMASEYGVPDGSSLADWPISYEELAPYYERAEWEIGVAGDSNVNPHQGARRRGYPMPPVAPTRQHAVLWRGAHKHGIHTAAAPMLINTVPFDGRAACAQCGMCVGFACASDSKNSSHNTMLPRAIATGRCRLLTQVMVERIETDSKGRAIGVSYFVGDARALARARAVVVSAGAIESARLLLNSASPEHPRGLGNDHDLVGRNLQGHYYPGTFGLFDNPVYDGIGPGVSISTCQFNHGNPGIIGGGMLANEFIKLPIHFCKWAWPTDVPRWGPQAKRWMRDAYTRTIQVMGPVQEIPSPESRVTLDGAVRDRWGIPVARLSGATHPQTVRTAEFMRQCSEQWLRASGAKKLWGRRPTVGLSAGQHQAGTCRMGADPRTSVTDRWGRVHGHENLFCADASLHVTNGGFNPVLTVMALSFRAGEHIAAQL
jgi:choline dehydrogenase-like flavoprotein